KEKSKAKHPQGNRHIIHLRICLELREYSKNSLTNAGKEKK
ncbi:15409_t:CDS:1, partial [Dentiscutata erythropus]